MMAAITSWLPSAAAALAQQRSRAKKKALTAFIAANLFLRTISKRWPARG